MLELRATEDVMTNRPELNRFILRNLKINTSGSSDPSDAKYIPFGLIYWDENGESVKEMILMNCSSGWVNDAGVDYTKISMDYFTKEQVESLFKEYLSLAAQFKIDDLENIPEQFPLVENLKNPNYVKLIFGNESKIAEKFSKVDKNIITEMRNNLKTKQKIYSSNKIKKTIRNPDFKKLLIDSFASAAS